MFLGMYQNNDILSLLAVSMILYYLAEGYDNRWSLKSCAGLAVGLSVGLLSYYTIYGWLLMSVLFCLAAVLTNPEIENKKGLIVRRTSMVAGLCLLLAGWFFIRNAIILEGDILGMRSEQKLRQDPAYIEKFAASGKQLVDFVNHRREGMSAWQFLQMKDHEWLRMTTQSFVGVFGHMIIYLPYYQYGMYYAVFAMGMLLFCITQLNRERCKRNDRLFLMMILSVGICFLLHFWSSYARDYQPQGRYVITLAFPLSFMLVDGLEHVDIQMGRQTDGRRKKAELAPVLAVLWILMFIRVFFETMTKMLV